MFLLCDELQVSSWTCRFIEEKGWHYVIFKSNSTHAISLLKRHDDSLAPQDMLVEEIWDLVEVMNVVFQYARIQENNQIIHKLAKFDLSIFNVYLCFF